MGRDLVVDRPAVGRHRRPPGSAVALTPSTPPPAFADNPVASAPTSRNILNAVGVQLLGRAVGTVASVLTVALTTRHLGVDNYGRLTIAIVFVGLWTSLTELGVGSVIVRKVTGSGAGLGELVGVNLGLSLAYCVPLAALAAGSGLLVYRGETSVHAVLLVVCATLLPTAVANCFQPIFMTSVRFGAVALSDVTCRVASLAATIVVIAAHGGLVWFGAVQLVPPLIQIVVLGIAAYRLQPFRARFDLHTSRTLLRESLPQTGVLIVGVLYWRADAVILTLLGTTREVGAYGIAYTIAFTLSVLSSFFLSSSLSTMTTRFASDRAAFGRFVASGMESMLVLGLPIAVFGAILAHPIVELLGTREFARVAAVPLALLLVSVALTFLTGVLSQALFAAHDQVFLLRLNIVNLVVNIGLNVILVPHFGAVGCACALLVSEVSGLAVTSWRLRRTCPTYNTPWRFLAHLLLPLAVGAGIAVLLRPAPVLLALVAVGAAYLLVNLVAGPVRLGTVRTLVGRGEPAVEREPVLEGSG